MAARCLTMVLFWSATLLLTGSAVEFRSKEAQASQLFELTKIWDVHLQFEPAEWEAMEPEGGKGGPFGGGGPGGFQMPKDFGTGTFLAPGFLKAGDQDQDRQLSKAEFLALGEKWFSEWDKSKTGKLTGEQVRDGLNAVVGPPRFPPPGMNGRSPLQAAEGKRNGVSGMMGIEFKEVHADMEFNGEPLKDIAIRYKGNGTFLESRRSLKRSLKVDTNDFVKGQKLAGLTKLNFHNNVTDPSSMNEVLSLQLFRDAGVPASRTAYARVYVTVAGKYDRKYFGLYSIVENVDDDFAKERFGSKKGAIFKPSTPRPFTDLGDAWKAYNQAYDPKTELTVAQAERVMEFCKLVSKADDAEFEARVGDYLDLEEFARFMAVTVYLSSMDSILGVGQNYYVYLHPESRKLQFIPWDHDHSFGQFGMGGAEQPPIHQPWQGENPFLNRVFKVEKFKKRYLEVMEEFSKTIFQPERFHRQVDELAGAIRTAVQEESEELLGRFDRAVAGEPSPSAPPAGRPTKSIKTFVGNRTQAIADQLEGKPIRETETPGSGFGRRGGPGGPPGGPGAFGPGMFTGPLFLKALDTNQDGVLEREEFEQGFARWFAAWSTDESGVLTEEQLRSGINKALPLPPGFGAPPAPPPPPPQAP